MLLVIAFFVAKNVAERDDDTGGSRKINIPWFAILFLVVIGFNSLNLLPKELVEFINTLDTFLLTMAMSASLVLKRVLTSLRKQALNLSSWLQSYGAG